MRGKLGSLACLVIAGLLAAPAAAGANAGYPMIVAVWPAAWYLIAPVILIEAFVASRVLQCSPAEGAKVSSIGNVVSAFVGVPLTWFALALGVSEVGSRWPPPDTPTGRLVNVTLGSAWLMPYDDGRDWSWMVTAAGLSLCPPFFFVSVGVEGLVARGLLGSGRWREAWRWAWMGNALSYALIVVLLAARLVRQLG